ncbi:MAG: N-acetyl-alpha-D-glucosaminyl L-malate synthase BshA [Actinobacteria bacterium]|nr:N-acetyl-alpha-D-glucosaminyl L-malate synthase BshA [Actinomycetota bacterium]
MKIGIVCYPSVGGSGIVATELGKDLALRGHEIHFICSDVPFRLREFHENIFYHGVETPLYPLFTEAPYFLSLSSKIAEVARLEGLDIVHAHYAIPHATSAYLARMMLGGGKPRIVTTLHGTDITLLGSEPSFAEIIAFSINASDGVTAVSESLKRDTYRALPVKAEISTIPNFLDCEFHRRVSAERIRERFARPWEKVIIHMSNFRAVKRVDTVIKVFARIAAEVPAQLLMIGDGPERSRAQQLAASLGLCDRVHFLGNQESVIELLSTGDLFLLPSTIESFGLAALEAMACEVPVVASKIGGLPEVVVEGITGYLLPPEDVDGMAGAGVRILSDGNLHAQMAGAARARVLGNFCAARIVPMYEAYYRKVLEK